MSISAVHWSTICKRVQDHARELHPTDPEKQQDLVEHLLALNTRRHMERTEKELTALENRVARKQSRLYHPNPLVRFFWRLWYV